MYPAKTDEKNIDKISALNNNFNTHINGFVFLKLILFSEIENKVIPAPDSEQLLNSSVILSDWTLTSLNFNLAIS